MKKIILLLETIACFGPITLLLILGVIGTPFVVLASVDQNQNWLFWLSVPLGLIGLYGAFQLIIKVLDPDINISSPKKLRLMLVSGILAIAIHLSFNYRVGLFYILIVLLPLFATAHFTYMARGYVFNKGS